MKTGKILLIAAAAAAGAAAAGAAVYLTTKLWVETALDREQPKITKKAGGMISGGRANAGFKAAVNKAADALRSQNHREVKISAYDGVELAGHFFPCENAERIIIAFHGWRSSWNGDFGLISEFWHKNNCSVLYAEQRGQNGSGGEYMGFGLTERFDCVRWTEWAAENGGDSLPVYLAGISMGAATVLMSSNLNFPIKPCGIMADCGFTSPKAIWTHVARNNLHLIYRVQKIIADEICKSKINMASEETSAPKALAETDIPILFIHGTDDTFVPIEMTYENYKACASPKRLLVVPGADHAMSYYIAKAEYEKAEKEFWQEFDKRKEAADEIA